MCIVRNILGCLILGFALIVSGPAAHAQQWNVRVGGTTIGGAFYPLAAAIAKVVNEKSEKLNLTVQTTPGAGANIRLLDSGDIDVGLSVTGITYYAVNGLGSWDKKYAVENLMVVFPNAMNFVVLESSDIKSIEDLKGKSITGGGPGAQWEIFIEPILSLYGMSYDDLGRVLHMGQKAAADALKDGRVDAAFLGGGNPNISPTPSIAGLESTHKIRFLHVPADRLAKVQEKAPFMSTIKIKSGAYNAQPEATVWPNVGAMHLVVRADADPEMVYELAKTIFENREEIAKVNKLALSIVPEGAASDTGIPYNDGATRFYKEAGVWTASGQK